jgi:hypothetical protein
MKYGPGQRRQRRAALFYLDVSKEKMLLEDHGDPAGARLYLRPDATRHRHGDGTMYKAGILKTQPQSWKDMYPRPTSWG